MKLPRVVENFGFDVGAAYGEEPDVVRCKPATDLGKDFIDCNLTW